MQVDGKELSAIEIAIWAAAWTAQLDRTELAHVMPGEYVGKTDSLSQRLMREYERTLRMSFDAGDNRVRWFRYGVGGPDGLTYCCENCGDKEVIIVANVDRCAKCHSKMVMQ